MKKRELGTATQVDSSRAVGIPTSDPQEPMASKNAIDAAKPDGALETAFGGRPGESAPSGSPTTSKQGGDARIAPSASGRATVPSFGPKWHELAFGFSSNEELREHIDLAANYDRKASYFATGGVAFVRRAANDQGWTISRINYDPRRADGRRFSAILSRPDQGAMSASLTFYDWEVVPVLRFVASDHNAAFSLLNSARSQELADPPGSSGLLSKSLDDSGVTPLRYHAAFHNTLMGLRLAQLDLLLTLPIMPEAFDWLVDQDGALILGPGENVGSIGSLNAAARASRALEARKQAVELLSPLAARECALLGESFECEMYGVPWSNFVIGDLLTPVKWEPVEGNLTVISSDLCWEFMRPPLSKGEPVVGRTWPKSIGANGVVVQTEFSEAVCEIVRDELEGMQPLAYRAVRRAMQVSALMRQYKDESESDFRRLLKETESINLSNVLTPTSVAWSPTPR